MDDRCENNLKSSDRLKQEANDLAYCMESEVLLWKVDQN